MGILEFLSNTSGERLGGIGIFIIVALAIICDAVIKIIKKRKA